MIKTRLSLFALIVLWASRTLAMNSDAQTLFMNAENEQDKVKKLSLYQKLCNSADAGVSVKAITRVAIIYHNQKKVDEAMPYWQALVSQNNDCSLRPFAYQMIGSYYVGGWTTAQGTKVAPNAARAESYFKLSRDLHSSSDEQKKEQVSQLKHIQSLVKT